VTTQTPAAMEAVETQMRVLHQSGMLEVVPLSSVRRPGVVLPVRPDPRGVEGPTPSQARGPHWRWVAPSSYVPAATDSSALDQRIVEAMAGMPDGAAVTGWASLGWRRAPWFHGRAADGSPLDVPVAVDRVRGVRRRPGVELSEDWLFTGDIEEVDGLPVTIPTRAVTYEVCRARTLIAAVRTIDLACAADLVELTSLQCYVARLVGRPGVRLLRVAVAEADKNVWSPQEVPLRILWRRQISCTLAANRPVFDLHGRHLLTPDVIDEEAGVAGEYNGAVHLQPGPRRVDLDREEVYRDHGLELVTMMSAARPDAASFASRLHAAYRRAEKRRDAPRSWTTEQPDWWVDTSTVAARRALTDEQRRRWLRHRAG